MISDEKLKLLKEYFKNRNDVALAFLFGSHAKGRVNKFSNLDIAVYFYPKKAPHRISRRKYFTKVNNEIWIEIERILKRGWR